MDWSKGFSALYELKRVDPASWMDVESLEFTAGAIHKSSDTQLIESADLTLTDRIGECWVRVYLKARQESGGARSPVFTGLAIAPRRERDGRRSSYKTECYSVLKPAEDTLTPRGYYAPAGAPAAQLAASLLGVGPAPVEYEADGPTLTDAIVSEDSDTNLSMAVQIIEAIGWRIRITGSGRIQLLPQATEPTIRFDPLGADSIELKVTDEDDWFSCPNVFRAVSGSAYAEAWDDDPDSSLSVSARKANRGGTGEIWAQDTSVSLGDQESLAEYARRRLKAEQSHARSIEYARRFYPDLTVTDLVALRYPEIGVDGTFRITEQDITLGHGAKTGEKVVSI